MKTKLAYDKRFTCCLNQSPSGILHKPAAELSRSVDDAGHRCIDVIFSKVHRHHWKKFSLEGCFGAGIGVSKTLKCESNIVFPFELFAHQRRQIVKLDEL